MRTVTGKGLGRREPVPGEIWVKELDGGSFRVVRVSQSKVAFKRVGGRYEPIQTTTKDAFKRTYSPATKENGVGAVNPLVLPRVPTVSLPSLDNTTAPVELEAYGINLRVSLEIMTPEKATAWLARGGLNRAVTESQIDKVSAAILRGEWQVTGETVILDSEDRVMDGQHRLLGVIRSGVAVPMLIVRGVDEEAFKVMGSGKSRTIADVLSIEGYPSAHGLSAAVRMLIFYEDFQTIKPGQRTAKQMISAPVVLDYLQKQPTVIDGYHLGQQVRQRAKLGGGVAVWAFLFTLFNDQDTEKAHEFAEALKYGADLEKTNPALVLLQRLRVSTGPRGWDPEELAALAIKAWNAYRAGRPMSKLSFRTGGDRAEAFPALTKATRKRAPR